MKKIHEDNEPMVTQSRALAMQVCVPSAWTDAEVEGYANQKVIAGTQNGWKVRKQGDEALAGKDERAMCGARGDRGFVHIMLDC